MAVAGLTDLGIDPVRLERLTLRIAADVAAERYDGAVVLVARRGRVALHEAVGFAERASERAAHVDDVFNLFSVTKTFTAVSRAPVCRARRASSSTHPVAEVIPEFAAKGKQRVTLAQLLTHTAGLPVELPFMDFTQFGDTTAVALAVSDQVARELGTRRQRLLQPDRRLRSAGRDRAPASTAAPAPSARSFEEDDLRSAGHEGHEPLASAGPGRADVRRPWCATPRPESFRRPPSRAST